MTSPDLARIRRWSIALSVLSILMAVAIALAIVATALFGDLPPDLARTAGVAEDALARPHLALVVLIGALPGVAAIWTLLAARRLFRRFAAGEVLTPAVAGGLGRVGAGLLAIAALGLVARPLQTVLASLGNPPGSRVLALSIESPDLGLLLSGGLMTVIGWILAEAARIADENRRFV